MRTLGGQDNLMATESSTIVQRLWKTCNVLRDDGMSVGVGLFRARR
jgi:hypothetical protein